MKRLFDVIVALILFVLVSPILLVVAAAIVLESSGGVFFRQERVGYQGRAFSIFKFRSMIKNANKIGPYYTTDHDPRITKVGKFIRYTSLDELPQLINVLKGDMSLVGPRPDVPAQRSLYTEAEWRKRHLVRPGMTGLAQATVRSKATEDQRKELDLEYVGRRSFWFDLWILIMTVRQVLFKGGN